MCIYIIVIIYNSIYIILIAYIILIIYYIIYIHCWYWWTHEFHECPFPNAYLWGGHRCDFHGSDGLFWHPGTCLPGPLGRRAKSDEMEKICGKWSWPIVKSCVIKMMMMTYDDSILDSIYRYYSSHRSNDGDNTNNKSRDTDNSSNEPRDAICQEWAQMHKPNLHIDIWIWFFFL